MSKIGEEIKEIELEEDTYVGNTCTECLKPCLFLGQMEDSDKYLCIGEGDQNEVKATDNKNPKDTIEFIDVNIFSGKLQQGHMFIVSVGY